MALLSKGITLAYASPINNFLHTITVLDVEGMVLELHTDREEPYAFVRDIADMDLVGTTLKIDGKATPSNIKKDGDVLVITASEKTYRVSELDDDVVTPYISDSTGEPLVIGDRVLSNLQEIAELGNNAPEKVDITVLSDEAKKSMDGLRDTAQDLAFKFLYEKAQFNKLAALNGSRGWIVTLPDNTTATFTATASVKLDSAGVGAALTYTLTLSVTSEIVFES